MRYRTQLCTEFAEEDSDAPTIRPYYSNDLKLLHADVGQQYKVERIARPDGTDDVGLADLNLNQAG